MRYFKSKAGHTNWRGLDPLRVHAQIGNKTWTLFSKIVKIWMGFIILRQRTVKQIDGFIQVAYKLKIPMNVFYLILTLNNEYNFSNVWSNNSSLYINTQTLRNTSAEEMYINFQCILWPCGRLLWTDEVVLSLNWVLKELLKTFCPLK